MVQNRGHIIFRRMKGLVTEVCAGLRKPTARSDATSGLEGTEGRNSVVGLQRERRPGGPERAVVTEGGNRGQSSMNAQRSKHSDLTFSTLAKHRWKPESGGVRVV